MFTSKRHPNGGASSHFDNARLESVIAAYQAGTDPAAAVNQIVRLTQTRALTLIRFLKTNRYVAEDPDRKLLNHVSSPCSGMRTCSGTLHPHLSIRR